ncbi:MAG: HNH endonuclease family protein [Gammaproteobacteria bacterium]|nr:HNH endonuclease family protein [Gammaproteobacteria bacterium]
MTSPRPYVLAAAALAAAAALGVEPGTWCGLKVEPENRCSPYDRKHDYSYPASIEWDIVERRDNFADPDGVLDRPFPSPYVAGLYFDRIKGRRGLDESHGGHRHLATGTDIEHIVAAAEAHDSGLCRADRETRTRFARDLDNLTLASPGVNRHSKSDKDAAEWLPPDNRRWYARTVVRVKRKYGLSVDAAERDALADVLGGRCR